jgi:hypothetical protein
LDPDPSLFTQTSHPNHKEFVHIGATNRQKLGSFEQWILQVKGFTEHTLIEFDPTLFAIEQPGSGYPTVSGRAACAGHGSSSRSLVMTL